MLLVFSTQNIHLNLNTAGLNLNVLIQFGHFELGAWDVIYMPVKESLFIITKAWQQY